MMMMAVLFLAGCGDRIEIEKRAYVVVLGIDPAPNGLIRVTFQIANPQVGSSERAQAQNEPAGDVITLTASDIVAARELANTIIPRRLTFSHMHTMIVGEELARTPMLYRVLSSTTGEPEFRREMNVVVSKESAFDFIQANKPKLETRPHKYYQFLEERLQEASQVSTINRYFQRLQGELLLLVYATSERNKKTKSDVEDYTAGEIPQQAGDPVQVAGAAVLKNGKMIGKLTLEEAQFTLLLRRKSPSHDFVLSVPDPKNDAFRVTFRVLHRNHAKIKIDVKKDPVEVRVSVPIKVQVLAIPSLTDYVLNDTNRKLLQKEIKESFENKSMKLVEKTQKQFGSEPFNWSLNARKSFLTLPEFSKYNWEEKYAEAKVQIRYDIEIVGFGKQYKPLEIDSTREKTH
jgi:spore germination protein KC